MLDRAFIASLAEGDIEEAVRLAERVLQVSKNDRTRGSCSACARIKTKQWQQARTNLAQSVRGPVTDLTAALLIAWTQYGANDSKTAIEVIDRLQGPDWYAIFKDQHAGLILDIARQEAEAKRRFEKVHKLDGTNLRVVEAYGSFLSRHGTKDEALEVYETFEKALPRHPLVTDRRSRKSRPARNCRRWSRTRRPAPPKCCTASAPRSAAAAARISASPICSSRSISSRAIRSPCCRSPTSMRR